MLSAGLSGRRTAPHIRERIASPHPRNPMFDTIDFVLDEHANLPASSAGLTPPDDAALLDAYSQAIADVCVLVGPPAVRIDVWHGRKAKRAGSGSGDISAADGGVRTNSHVV